MSLNDFLSSPPKFQGDSFSGKNTQMHLIPFPPLRTNLQKWTPSYAAQLLSEGLQASASCQIMMMAEKSASSTAEQGTTFCS